MTGRTHRSPDGVYAGPGAVRQHGGKLPIYVCNTCGMDVVWVESKTTGRKYLVTISHGANGHRFYIGANVHDCAAIMARRAQADYEREWQVDASNAAIYLLHLTDQHDEGLHVEPVAMCHRCQWASTHTEAIAAAVAGALS